MIFRVFADSIRSKQAHYFTCTNDKSLTLQESGAQYYKQRNELIKWSKLNSYPKLSVIEMAKRKLENDLKFHEFYDYKIVNGIQCPVRSKNPIISPLSDKDEGIRYLNCLTDVRGISYDELAEILVKVNSRTINNYFQELRRRISILERPLMTARGDGKSYIYANYNPRYAQYVTTIMRTFYNFCWTKKRNGNQKTPAQRLGIAKKVYDVKDIVYFR